MGSGAVDDIARKLKPFLTVELWRAMLGGDTRQAILVKAKRQQKGLTTMCIDSIESQCATEQRNTVA